MKALFVATKGDDQQLEYGDVAEPEILESTDVIVRVRATALNRLDMFRLMGSHGVTPPKFPYVGGSEYAGDVVEVGSAVSHLRTGDRVFGTASHTFADYALVREAGRGPHQRPPLKMPPGLSYEEAAAIPISFCMAWHMLYCKGQLVGGEDVLVMGGGSGTGTSGIQLAMLAGARVITTASTDEKLEKAKALGVDDTFNYREIGAFSQTVRDMTGGKGVDMVFEHIGAPVWEECFKSLKRGGRLIICGVTGGHWAKIHLGQVWSRNLAIIGCTNEPENDFEQIVPLVGRGLIRGIVDSVFPLESGQEAYTRMEARDYFGKIVLQVP